MFWTACWLVAALLSPNDLAEVVRKYDVRLVRDPGTGRKVIRWEGGSVIFSPGLSVAVINGIPRTLSRPVRILGGRIQLPPEIVSAVRRTAPLRPAPRRVVRGGKPKSGVKPFPPFSIVIDAGHGRGGQNHTGGVGKSGLMEKNINLDVAKRLQKILKAGNVRTVIMTRTDEGRYARDKYEDLQYRVDKVNRANPTVFVSIHTNYVDRPEPRGFEVWVPANAWGKRNRSSRKLASLIRSELKRAIGYYDRGTKDDKNLYVLRKTRCPAVLVEMEFISNPRAEALLAKDWFKQKIAVAIANALRKYVSSGK